jgi:hypothetical protein
LGKGGCVCGQSRQPTRFRARRAHPLSPRHIHSSRQLKHRQGTLGARLRTFLGRVCPSCRVYRSGDRTSKSTPRCDFFSSLRLALSGVSASPLSQRSRPFGAIVLRACPHVRSLPVCNRTSGHAFTPTHTPSPSTHSRQDPPASDTAKTPATPSHTGKPCIIVHVYVSVFDA